MRSYSGSVVLDKGGVKQNFCEVFFFAGIDRCRELGAAVEYAAAMVATGAPSAKQ